VLTAVDLTATSDALWVDRKQRHRLLAQQQLHLRDLAQAGPPQPPMLHQEVPWNTTPKLLADGPTVFLPAQTPLASQEQTDGETRRQLALLHGLPRHPSSVGANHPDPPESGSLSAPVHKPTVGEQMEKHERNPTHSEAPISTHTKHCSPLICKNRFTCADTTQQTYQDRRASTATAAWSHALLPAHSQVLLAACTSTLKVCLAQSSGPQPTRTAPHKNSSCSWCCCGCPTPWQQENLLPGSRRRCCCHVPHKPQTFHALHTN